MPRKISSYRDLEIWQESVELVVDCYRLCDELPRSEDFGLKGQIRRAVVSVPTNIAEGHGRSTTGEYLYHAGVAHGSLMELETDLLIAARLEYVTDARVCPLLERTERIGKKTNVLMVRLKDRQRTNRRGRSTEFEVPDA